MKRKHRSTAPITEQQATIRRLTRRHFLGTGLVAGIGAAVLAPRIASSLRVREAKALIGQPQAGFYKGMCYAAFPAPYDPSHANSTCIFFGSDVAYNPMAPLWGTDYQSQSGMRFSGRNDLKTMKDMGVNVVRLYDWSPRDEHLNFLNYCDQLGIRVLVGVSNYFLKPDQGYPQRETLIPELIRSYRNAAGTDYHPAILGIMMGNEPRLSGDPPFTVAQSVQFTQDWVRIEEEQFSGFSKPLIGHPVDFHPYGGRYPAWGFFAPLLEGLSRTTTRDLQNRLFLAANTFNNAVYLFDNAEGSGKGYVQLTYEMFHKPLLFTEIGNSRSICGHTDPITHQCDLWVPNPNYLEVVDGQLNRSIAYGMQHPEQLLGICHFQFSDKVWLCPTGDPPGEYCPSEGTFGVFSHTNRVREIVNYVPEDFKHFENTCAHEQLKPDYLTENPTYYKVVANYGGRGR